MTMTLPNLRHLRAFREVARQRSISQASGTIFLSPPAITQAIAKLEKQVGSMGFERRSDGMYTTEAGVLFLARSDRVLDSLRTARPTRSHVDALSEPYGGAPRAGIVKASSSILVRGILLSIPPRPRPSFWTCCGRPATGRAAATGNNPAQPIQKTNRDRNDSISDDRTAMLVLCPLDTHTMLAANHAPVPARRV